MPQSGIKTPGVYTGVNINTARTGLPQNAHKVLFLTTDDDELSYPVAIYDQKDADMKVGEDSIAGRMIKAAVKTNRLIDAHVLPITNVAVSGGENAQLPG